MDGYEWTNEMTSRFVDLYQAHSILWDPKHRCHKDRVKVNNAWRAISKNTNTPVNELKKKKNSIMASFRGHLRKKKASISSGAGPDDVYMTKWFLYNQLENFLGNVNECVATLNMEHVSSK